MERQDRNFMICQIITAGLGAVWILVKRNFVLLAGYIPLMALAIPMIYFNYRLCKWQNKWHGVRNERYPCDGEPSDRRLIIGKVSSWVVYIVALILAILPEV